MKNWKSLVLGLGVFLCVAIILLTGGADLKWNSIAIGGLMIYLWVFEVIPIYVTALFPLLLAVPLGILDTEDLAKSYGNSNVFLFFGGFVLALALEKWLIHEQIARGILALVGKSKTRIILGFLLATGFLSMWISNTATALMMLPMATAVISALPKSESHSKFPLFLLLSVAYAASVGGMATLVGSPPNVQMASILEQNHGIVVGFFDWMKIALPISLCMLICIFLVFYLLMGKERNGKEEAFEIHKKPWTRDQIFVLIIFGVVVALWSFRELFNHLGLQYRDEGPAILGAILLFILPGTNKKPFLNWKDTEKLPWGILILFGGGLALAAMFEKNGVIKDLTDVFQNFNNLSFVLLLIIIVAVAIFASEVMSNLALVTVFVPLFAAFAVQADYPILQLCIPVTLGASSAFMMPVGTPPNAIVFATGLVHINQMVKIGFILNLIAVVIITAFCWLLL